MLYLLFKFLLSGAIVVGVTLFAQIHPKWGGVVAVAPIISTLAIIFLSQETTAMEVQKVIAYSVCYMLPTTIFLVLMYLLLDRYGLPMSMFGSYLVWIVMILVMQKGLEISNWMS